MEIILLFLIKLIIYILTKNFFFNFKAYRYLKNEKIFNEMINSNLKLFIDEILDYHKHKPLRSYREYNENAFHSAIEVLLRSF